MKKLCLGLIFCAVINTAIAQQYNPKFKSSWKEVDNYIRGQWDNQLTKSNEMPNIYIGAWPYLPFMFYWDTYFTNLGLYVHNFETVAKWNTENLLSVVDKFGYMGNAAVTSWGMNRSQPPYLSSMVRDVFEQFGSKDTAFLRKAYPILRKEYLFWTDTSKTAIEDHKTAVPGLNRFYHHAKKEDILPQFEEVANRFDLKKDISEAEKEKLVIPYIVEAATGMDFTPRFEHRCQDFVAVELNCLLYIYEKNFEWMVDILGLKGEPDWKALANRRKILVNKYCWDEKRGLYLDYDFVNKRRSKVAAITTFQPLWAGIASQGQAEKVVKNLKLFEGEWGVATVEKCGEIKNYQWGETSIWAPMQMITVKGLENYGFKNEARRIAGKYLDLVSKNYLDPVPRAYIKQKNAVTRSTGKTYEKYKIDGTLNDDEYVASEMMGWTGATFAWFYQYLKKTDK